MVITKDVIQYSKHYFKTLTDKSFKEVLNQRDDNARLRAFLPLYSSINRNYGFIRDPSLLREVARYIEIIENDKEDEIFNNFKQSMTSYFKMKEKKPLLKGMVINNIKCILSKESITTYKLNNEYGINLKICSQLKGEGDISMSITSLNQLYIKLKKDFK